MDAIGLRIALCLTLVVAGIAIAWTSRAAAKGRLGRNSFAGIRTPTTMHSDETWFAAHRASRKWTDIGGGLSIAIGLGALVPMPEPMFAALGLAGAACLLGFTLRGAWVGVRTAREVTSDEDTSAGSVNSTQEH